MTVVWSAFNLVVGEKLRNYNLRKDLERLCRFITRPAHACGGQSGSKSAPTGRRRDRPIRVRGNFLQNSAQINHFAVR